MNAKLKGMQKALRLKRKIGTQRDEQTWIFSSTDNVKFNYNSKYLFLYVKDHYKQIKPRYVMNDPDMRAQLQRRYGEEYFIDSVSDEGVCEILKAGVWFTSAGLPVYGTGLKKNRRIINLWHGVPLKRIALEDPQLSLPSRLYFKMIFSANYTDIVTTSNHLRETMTKSFAVGQDLIRIWGQPRNDCMLEKLNRLEYLKNIYGELPEFDKVVLYAPTFRDGKNVQLFPFSDFDRDRLEQYLQEHKMLLLIRTHVEEAEHNETLESAHVRFFNEDCAEDVMEGLSVFDLLITDYSSIYIDYMILDRPVMFLPYDYEEYSRGHGFTFPYEEVTPGPKPKDFQAFLNALTIELKEDTYKEERQKVNAFFNECEYPCAEKICSEVIHKMEESK